MYAVPIWQMKFCTKSVLVDRRKVAKSGKTYIYFVADRNWPLLYSVDGGKVWESNRLIFNGKIVCFDIPADWLIPEGELPQELVATKEKEYAKFKRFQERSKHEKGR